MSRNYLILLIIAGFVGLLLGCHAGGNSPMAPDNSATTVLPETRTVNENGRFTDITFPSGAVIKCPNDKTFQEGVKVTAVEEKVPVIADNSGKFSYIYVYNISAVLPSENSLTADVPVNTIEKPLSVTLPNDSTAGTCYIGTRASDKDPWRYSLATDGLNSNARFMRLSANTPKTCTFNLYRLNIQFRLFVFDNEEKKDEVQVDSIAMEPAEDVEIKDGKYTGKLSVKLNVEGDNLNGLKAEDLIAKITYRSENQQGANIDFTANKNDSTDKAVTGSYEHSFEVSNIKVENTLGNTAELSFELNLDGVSLDDFPKDFLVEFYSKGSDENTRPFEYTQAFSFETKENEPTPEPEPHPDPDNPDQPSVIYAITYNLDGGEPTGNNPEEYGTASDPITLSNPTKDGYTFLGWTGTDLDNPTTQVIIEKGSTGNREYKANWKQNAADEFTLTLVAGTGIASVDEEKAYKQATSITLNYTLKDGYEFVNWTDSNGNAVTSPFTMPQKAVTLTANAKVINYNITYQNTDGATFVTANPENYNVETESFTLTNPTKDDYIFLGWTYEGQTTPQFEVTITKGSTTGAKSFTANWEAKAVASLKSASTEFTVNGQIQIEFDKDITWQDSFKDNITITPTTPITTITINTYSYNNKVLTLTPASNLKYNTGYTIAIAGIEKVSDKNLTFTTIDLSVTPVITSASTNTVAELEGKTILQPTFTIDFGKSVVNQTIATSSIKLNANALPDSASFAFDTDGKIATLTFSSNLEVDTAYQLSITGFTDDDNSTINAVSAVSFTTIASAIFGSGTENNPYLIFTQTDLQKLCDNAYNYGDPNNEYKPFCFKQMNDITLTSANWTPIENENSSGFYGKYNGNNHKITGLKIINNVNDSYAGLFCGISGSDESNRAEIKNLTLENVDLSYGSTVGALAGTINYADISNVKITGNINIDCREYIGGLAGVIVNSTISNVHLSGNISIKGSNAIGGLAGRCSNVQISGCSVYSPNGLIDVGKGSDVGGLVGRVNDSGITSISNSYASIEVQGNDCVGGLVGVMANCTIENSYSDTAITALEYNNFNGPSCIGGLVGILLVESASFNNCYSSGTIYINAPESKKAECVGGLVGKLYSESPTFDNSTNSFSSVSISVSEDYTENLTGSYYNPDPANPIPLYCKYYNSTYIYEDDSNHNYISNGYPATGLNWDASVWSGLSAGGYPTLINNPPPAQP